MATNTPRVRDPEDKPGLEGSDHHSKPECKGIPHSVLEFAWYLLGDWKRLFGLAVIVIMVCVLVRCTGADWHALARKIVPLLSSVRVLYLSGVVIGPTAFLGVVSRSRLRRAVLRALRKLAGTGSPGVSERSPGAAVDDAGQSADRKEDDGPDGDPGDSSEGQADRGGDPGPDDA